MLPASLETYLERLRPVWVELSLMEGAEIRTSGNSVEFHLCTDCGDPLVLDTESLVSLVDSVLILLDRRGMYRFSIDTSTLAKEHPDVLAALDRILLRRYPLSTRAEHDELMVSLSWVAKAVVFLELYRSPE